MTKLSIKNLSEKFYVLIKNILLKLGKEKQPGCNVYSIRLHSIEQFFDSIKNQSKKFFLQKLDEEIKTVSVPVPVFWKDSKEKLIENNCNVLEITDCQDISYPSNFLSVITHVQINPGESLIIREESFLGLLNNYLIQDLDDSNLIDNGIFMVKQNDALFRKEYKFLNSGLFLCGVDSHNYYHWLFEHLPMLEIFDICQELDEFPILIPSNLPSPMLEVLKIFNKKNRKIIELDYKKTYILNHLAVASPGVYMPMNFKKNSIEEIQLKHCLFSPKTIDYVRNSCSELISQETPHRKIYLKRNSNYRHCLNQDEIINFLETQGFEIISPETLSFGEQVKLFSSAKIVVAPAGASLSNIVFMLESTHVINLMTATNITPCFSSISHKRKVNLINLPGYVGKTNSVYYYHSNYMADFESLQDILKILK